MAAALGELAASGCRGAGAPAREHALFGSAHLRVVGTEPPLRAACRESSECEGVCEVHGESLR